MTYTLRVSVRTHDQKPISGIDEPVEIKIDQRPAIFLMQFRYLIVRVSGFSTTSEAEAFLPFVQAGLWNIALVHHVAFVPDFRRCEITYAKDPVKAGKNFAKDWGSSEVDPVHGLSDEGGYSVFRTDQNIRFLGIEATGHASSQFDQIAPTFVEAVKTSDAEAISDPTLATAIMLYVGQFFESSLRARLLTVMMILEVLSPDMPKHESAIRLLEKLMTDIDKRLQESDDEEERFALESLRRELDFRKETSIRRRVRELVMRGAGLHHADRKQLARDVVYAYDLRGKLVHTGTIEERGIHAVFHTVFEAATALLRGRLGLQD